MSPEAEIKIVADKLVQAHYKHDRQMARARVFLSPNDQTIRLLELTEAVPTENNVSVISFDAAPSLGVPYPSAVILVNQEDWDGLANGQLSMPESWGSFADGIDFPRHRRTK